MILSSVRLFMHDALRASLCVSLVFSSVGWSAEPSAAQRASRTGEVYTSAKSPESSNVYFEGGNDDSGRAKVWSYIEAKGNKPAQYRYGVIESDGKVTWQTAQTVQPVKPTNVPQTAAPAATAPSVNAPVTPVKPNARLAGEIVKDAKSPIGAEVYYSGKVDASGRFEVWTYEANTAKYTFGAQDSNGKITWYNEKGEVISAEADPNWKPSRLKDRLTGEKAQRLWDSLSKGQRSHQEYLRDAEKILQTPGGAIGGAMITFYIAMGMIAAVTVMTEYPNNPLALEKYLEKLTDPMGWMMLAGFLMVASPFLAKVNGLSTGKQVIRAVPYFAAGLLAGAVVQGMMTYATDKDVRKCLGLASRDMLFQRDMAACDAAYEKLSTEQVSLSFVPAIAGVMAAGGTYLGLSYVSNVAGLSRLLRSLPVMKGPKGGAVGMIFTGVVFLGAYEFSDAVFKVEKKTRDYLIAAHSLGSNAYGAALADAEKNLYKGYAELRANKWIDRGAKDKDKAPDFKGVLDRYGTLQDRWRANQMAKTLESYNQWVAKVEGYHKLVNASFTTYKELMEHLQFDIMNPSSSGSDPRGFNVTAIRNLEKERAASGQDSIMNQDFNGSWNYVNTSKFYDFIVASMACGPEGEAKVERGIWQKSKDLAAAWITHNTTPKDVIGDSKGWSVDFHPPRVVQPMAANQFESICEYPATRKLPNPALLDVGMTSVPEKFLISPGLFGSGKSYTGLYDYIKDNIRPSIMENGNNQFIRWWAQNVMTQVEETEKSFRDEFEQMLTAKYKPAMIDQDYYWCEQNGLTDIGLNSYLRRLTPQGNKGCPIDWRSRLARGIMNGLTDEARLYIAMTIDVHMSSHKNAPPEKYKKMENELVQAGMELAVRLDALVKRMSVVNQDERGDISAVSEAAGNAFVKFAALIPARRHWVRPHAVSPQLQWEAIFLDKIQNLVQSTSNYYNILHTFEAETLKPAAPAPQIQSPVNSDRAEQQDEAQPSNEQQRAATEDTNQPDGDGD